MACLMYEEHPTLLLKHDRISFINIWIHPDSTTERGDILPDFGSI